MDTAFNLAGQTIGKYRIVELLGRGGMAEVYKTYQANLDRYVALKLMHAFLAGDSDFIERFEREAKNVATLRHPNIIQVYDFDVHNGTPYMVMEYIEGGTLKMHLEDLARRQEMLPTDEAIRFIREVGKALAYAHKRSMIHRDVKPANVMLDHGGRVILTDFGIAKILTGPSYTATGATIGTPSYMSPEQGLGRQGDHRSDIYSLGVMLYQLATGQLPFDAETPLAVMLKHVNEPMPVPRSVKPDIPEGLERIILKSMAKNPADRFQTADEMLASLDNLSAATLLSIPPASMAAGPAALVPTMAATPASTVVIEAQNEQTPLTTPQGVTRLGKSTQAPADTLVAERARPALRVTPLFAAAAVVIGLALGGAGYMLAGGFGQFSPAPTPTPTLTMAPTFTAQPSTTPTDTPVPASPTVALTSTPDQVATQFQSIRLTQAAIALALATATPTATPDLTATALACSHAFELTGQDPPDGKVLIVSAKVTKVLTVKNSGTCAFPVGTVLTETTAAGQAMPFFADLAAIEPGATTEISFDWPGPARASTVVRNFELRLPDGQVIGDPLSFTFKYVPPATRAPTATVPPPPPPTAVPTLPASSGLTDVYPASYLGCIYQGQNNMDYNCTARLGYGGGVGPFTLYVDGQRIGLFQPGESIYYNIVSRRCSLRPYSIRLVDDGSVTQIARDFSFDPGSVAPLFPGGSCTLP